jgi:hypothetical protein
MRRADRVRRSLQPVDRLPVDAGALAKLLLRQSMGLWGSRTLLPPLSWAFYADGGTR